MMRIEGRPCNQLAVADHCRQVRHHFSFGDDREAKRVGVVMMTCLAIALRGFLVTAAAVGIVAYLLLTRSHV